MDKQILIDVLPPYQDKWVLVNPDQDVNDIIRDILDRHEQFREYYDKIALFFDGDSIDSICNGLYNFCKKNIRYVEEKDSKQTTAIPTGILIRGYGDCKHYASFIGGVLDALNRLTERKINWCYRFASYEFFQKQPHHIFVIVKTKSGELWIDPTPGANEKIPFWQIDKKVKQTKMQTGSSIGRIGNVGALYTDNFALPLDYARESDLANEPVTDLDPNDTEIPADIKNDIQLLIDYNVADSDGVINEAQLFALGSSLDQETYQRILDAIYRLDTKAQIGGFFSAIWRGFKKISLAVPRGAYLSMVALNVFGLGSKLAQATSTTDGANKVRNKWYSLGGDWAKLRQAISNGQKRKRLLGAEIGVAAAAAPAWIATAAAIIAALAPIIKEILSAQKAAHTATVDGYDYGMGTDGNGTPPPAGGGSGSGSGFDPIQWAKDNPAEAALAAVVIFLGLKKFKVIK